MKPRRKLTPRKQPSQDRSRNTVSVILQAATYILVERGYDALTTNRIALRAGVNIATLYQYFPNKQSIVAELQRRHVTETRAATLAVLKKRTSVRPESLIRASIEAVVAAHRVQPKLHRIFTEESARLGLSSIDQPGDADTKAAQQAWIEHARSSIENPELSMWIIQTTIHALVHQAACERPQDLDREQFVEEVTRLIAGYVKRPPLDRPRSKKSRS